MFTLCCGVRWKKDWIILIAVMKFRYLNRLKQASGSMYIMEKRILGKEGVVACNLIYWLWRPHGFAGLLVWGWGMKMTTVPHSREWMKGCKAESKHDQGGAGASGGNGIFLLLPVLSGPQAHGDMIVLHKIIVFLLWQLYYFAVMYTLSCWNLLMAMDFN